MLTELELDIIERYLNNQLDSDELQQFLLNLKSNEELRGQLLKHSQLINLLKEEHEEVLKDQVQQAIPRLLDRSIKNRKWSYYVAAACLALIITFFTIFYLNNTRSASEKELLSEYFEPYPFRPLTRNGNSVYSNESLLYEEQRYTEVLQLLISLGNKQDSDNAYNLAVGSAYMGIGNWREASEWFEVCINSSDQLMENDSRWYYALSVMLMDKEKAKQLFLEIANVEGPYQQKSKEILSQLS